jgi:hypothetical protein
MSRAWIACVRNALIALAIYLYVSWPVTRGDEAFNQVTSWLQSAPEQVPPDDPPTRVEQQPFAITPEEPPAALPAEAPTTSGETPSNPFQPAPMQRPDLRCLNPNYLGHATGDGGFWDFFPEGMLPWSPRTPLADRHTEHGQPLTGTSWLNRPYYAGVLVGAWYGDELIDNELGQHTTFFGGYRVGWDYDYYWGSEARLALATPTLADLQTANDHRTADVLVADLNLMYYPWGDSRWRPYVSFGLGLGYFIFLDSEDRRFREVMVGMPLGIGVKYRWHEWLVLRADLQDNIMIENAGLSSMGNFSLTAGAEIRFGGHRTHYWPYHPGGFLC